MFSMTIVLAMLFWADARRIQNGLKDPFAKLSATSESAAFHLGRDLIRAAPRSMVAAASATTTIVEPQARRFAQHVGMEEEAEEKEGTEEAEDEEADEGEAKEAEVVSDEEAEEGADNETAEEKEVDPVVLGLKKELREAQDKITELDIFSNKVSKAYSQLKTESEGAKDRMETQLKVRTDVEKGRVVGAMFEPIENLNRMLATLKEDDPNRGGVQSILKQFQNALDSLGLEEIRDEGKPFDPNRHEAMMMNNVDDKKLDGCIVEVFESGYAVGTKLIRPARVIVGKYVEPPKEESEDEKEGEGEEDAAADE